MKQITIAQSALFKLTSYGNGYAYCLEYLPDGTSVFVAGDDAIQFRSEFEAIEAHWPELPTEQVCAKLWDDFDYGSAAS